VSGEFSIVSSLNFLKTNKFADFDRCIFLSHTIFHNICRLNCSGAMWSGQVAQHTPKWAEQRSPKVPDRPVNPRLFSTCMF